MKHGLSGIVHWSKKEGVPTDAICGSEPVAQASARCSEPDADGTTSLPEHSDDPECVWSAGGCCDHWPMTLVS